PTQRHVQERIALLAARLGGLDEAAQAVGHYAIGRARLALHEFEAARGELERAWQGGYRTPEAALALGQAYGELYQRSSDRLRSLPTEEQVAARKQQIERDLKQPALAYLRQSEGASGRVAALVE